MNKNTENSAINKIGIDLAKSSFQLYAEDELGKKIMNRKMSKKKLKEFMIRQKPCMIGMEACGSAHYWARLFRSWGHETKLMAPQFVKTYIKSNKHDAADAEAICEAKQRPNMRFNLDSYLQRVAPRATIDSMIKEFRHKGLKQFFETGSKKGIRPDHMRRLSQLLAALDEAEEVIDMDQPGWKLHPLKGDLEDHWSVRVSGNWRMTFVFEYGDADVVDYQDDH